MAVNRVTRAQIELMLDEIENNPIMALSRNQGPKEQQAILQSWDRVAPTLNAIGNGFPRSGDRWKRYWTNMKCTTKARAETLKQRKGSLNPRERRILAIAAKEALRGDKKDRVKNNGNAGTETPDPSAHSAQQSDQHSADPSFLRVYSAEDPLSPPKSLHMTLEPPVSLYELADVPSVTSPRSHSVSCRATSTTTELPRDDLSSKRHRRQDEDGYRRPREVMGRVPWYVDIEKKRLRAKMRTAAALTKIANAVEKQTNMTAQFLEHLKNKL